MIFVSYDTIFGGIISFTILSIQLRHMHHDFFKTGHGLRLVETSLRLGEDLTEWCVRIRPK